NFSGGAASNSVTASFGTVGGGFQNSAGGLYATVPGGISNSASASYSFCAGNSARAIYPGVFVWADSLPYLFDPFNQAGPQGIQNSFNVRSTGGFYIVTGVSTNGTITTEAYLSENGSGWNTLSDRNAKTNFEHLDPRDILERLLRVPVLGWNYKAQREDTRHIGPMAQDFNAAFNIGEADKAGERKFINSLDEEGVALAAIQGLDQKVMEKDAQIQKLTLENERLEQRLNDLEQRVSSRSGRN